MHEFCEHVQEAISGERLTIDQARELGGRKCPLCSEVKANPSDTSHITGGSYAEYPYWEQMMCGVALFVIVGGALYALAH